MAKKLALVLAGFSLVGCLSCSLPIVQNSGSFEALTAKKDIVNQSKGYDFFSGCIVEFSYDVPSSGGSTFTYKNETLFGDWYPFYIPNYVGDIEYSTNFYWSGIKTEVSTTTPSGYDDVPFDVWDRVFSGYLTDDYAGSEYNPSSYRVYSDTPFVVPLPFLRQFVLGLYLWTEGSYVSFQGDMYVYNFVGHTWSSISLPLRTGDEVSYNLSHSISPTAFDNVFNNPYFIYDYDEESSFDPLYYDDWCFVSLDFEWETDGSGLIGDDYLGYVNSAYNSPLIELLDIYTPANAHDDAQSLWWRLFGDTIYLEPINPPEIMFGTVESFLATEFIPDFSFGDLLLIVLGVMVFGAFLKVFLGG